MTVTVAGARFAPLAVTVVVALAVARTLHPPGARSKRGKKLLGNVQLLSQLFSGPSVDIEAIKKEASEAARKEYEKARKEDEDGVRRIELVLPDKPDSPVVDDLVHEMMPTLLEEVAIGNSVWLAGPAGSGSSLHAVGPRSPLSDLWCESGVGL